MAHTVHRPEQLVQVERLAHQGGRPQAVGRISSVRRARDDQQRHLPPAGLVSQLADEAAAIQVGQLQVEHDRVRGGSYGLQADRPSAASSTA